MTTPIEAHSADPVISMPRIDMSATSVEKTVAGTVLRPRPMPVQIRPK